MSKVIRSLSIFSLLLSFVAAGNAQKAPAKETTATWKNDASAATKLGPAEKVDGFLIDPPKGYLRVVPPGPEDTKFTGWVSDSRADGTRAQLVVMTFTPSGEVHQADLEPGLKALIDNMQAGRRDRKQGAYEHGSINGLPFVRTRWEAFDTTVGRTIFAFNYLTFVRGTVVQISSQDVEPYQKSALELAEASVLTFRTQ